MATADLTLQAVLAAAGWSNATLANLATSNDVRATGGTVGESITVSLGDVPVDFGSAGTITLAAEWAISGSATRAKSLKLDLRSADLATLHATYTTPTRSSGTADALNTSAALDVSGLSAAQLNDAVLQVTCQEGGGKGDNVTISIDHIVAPVLDYTPAAAPPPNEGSGAVALAVAVVGVGVAQCVGAGVIALALASSGAGATAHGGAGTVGITLASSGAGEMPSTVSEGFGAASVTLAVSGAGEAPLTQAATGYGVAAFALASEGTGARQCQGFGIPAFALAVVGVSVEQAGEVVTVPEDRMKWYRGQPAGRDQYRDLVAVVRTSSVPKGRP